MLITSQLRVANPDRSVFCHNRDTPGRTGLIPGSKVSFDYEMGQKGANAKKVQVEESAVKAEETREYGTIKVQSLLNTHGHRSYALPMALAKSSLIYSVGTQTKVSVSLVALLVEMSKSS